MVRSPQEVTAALYTYLIPFDKYSMCIYSLILSFQPHKHEFNLWKFPRVFLDFSLDGII